MARFQDHLWTRYRLTLDSYHAMLAAQRNSCYICDSILSKHNKPFVDHNHESKKTRKILCNSCNRKVDACEKEVPDSKHRQRRYDKAPYIAYLAEHGVIVRHNIDRG